MNAPARALPTTALALAAALVALAGPAHAQQVFDIVVSLESDPQGDPDRVAEYEAALVDFSNAVHEASEGAHAIGSISVYTASLAHERADVVWRRSGRPQSSPNGLAGPGRIYMVDRFRGGGSNGEDVDLLDDALDPGIGSAGAILAHEWAHYAYGLLDEHVVAPGDEPVRKSILSSPWEVVTDRSAAAFSVVSDGSTDDFRNTERTEHHRAYEVSAWELLADLPDGEDALLAPVPGVVERIGFPELASAAPDPTPQIDGDAPSAPTITWLGPCASYAIAIDNSGSMTGQRLENAKSAARLVVDRVVAERSWVSILTFASGASANFRTPAPVLVSDEGDEGETSRDGLLDRIDEIASVPQLTRFSAGVAGGKLMVDAGLDALSMSPSCDPTRVSAALFFLSDGSNADPDGTESDDLIAARDAFATDAVPIHVVDYGSPDPDAAMNPMTPLAAGTGGLLVISSFGAGPIDRLLEESENQVRLANRLHEDETLAFTVASNGSGSASFPVDPDSDRLTVCVSSDVPVGELSLNSQSIVSILPPTATRTTETSFDECLGLPSCPLVDDCSTLWSISNAGADPGTWEVVGEAADDANQTAQVTVSAVAYAVGESTTLQLYVLNGTLPMPDAAPELRTPEPVFLAASLAGALPAAGARLFASIDGTAVQTTLRDDGIPPDRRAGDGIYIGALATEGLAGSFDITVTATNALGVGALSPRGLVRAPSRNGVRLAPEADVPLSSVLFRTASTPVTLVDGGPPATIVDDAPQNGQIAVPGEIDSYAVDLSQVGTGLLQIRVTGALLGMVPRLRVIPQSGAPIEASAERGASGVGIEVDASLGLVQVEVSDAEGDTGTYQISAGTPLSQGFGQAGPSDTRCDLALADKDEALDFLELGLPGVPTAFALIEESRALEQQLIRDIEDGPGSSRLNKARRYLKRAANRDGKALKRMRKAFEEDRSGELKGARRKIKNARQKLTKACSRL